MSTVTVGDSTNEKHASQHDNITAIKMVHINIHNTAVLFIYNTADLFIYNTAYLFINNTAYAL